MRNFLIFILLITLSAPLAAQQNQAQQQLSKSQLASMYYRDKEFDKARDLFLELYESTQVISHFNNYINCLVNLKEYEQAENQLNKVLRKTNNVNLEITLGYVYGQMGDFQKSEKTYQKIIDNLKPNRGTIISIGNSFYNRREFEFAEKTYIRGQELMPNENFHSNLATIYANQRNYDKMMAEYLTLLRKDETQTSRIQSQLRSLLRYDFDNSLSETLKREIIKSIQAAPDVIAFNRMLIWFFTIEKNFEQALLNAIALDRRTNQEENDILNFSRSAARNELYEIALNGLDYLENRTPEPKIINDIKLEIVNTGYLRYINTPPAERPNGEELLSQFDSLISMLGYSQQTVGFIRTYAHFLAFYMNKTQEAQTILEKGLSSGGLNNTSRSVLQTEMADIYVYTNKLWEATLLYARIIEANKGNTLADEVMLKRARLSFYLGDIEWAKAQLDVLKASTSKLIANDAMDLSLLIASNYEMDTITEPVQMYARAELAIYRNDDKMALLTLDSLANQYPNHSLNDRILMKKAEISYKKFDFEQCASYYQQVFEKHAYSTLADDAMYKMARLYEEKMEKTDQATELYRRIMIEHPGSIHVADSRTRYRELTGKEQEQEMTPYEMHDFIVE